MLRWLFGFSNKSHPLYRMEALQNGQYRVRVLKKGRVTNNCLSLTQNRYHHAIQGDSYHYCLGTKEEVGNVVGCYLLKEDDE